MKRSLALTAAVFAVAIAGCSSNSQGSNQNSSAPANGGTTATANGAPATPATAASAQAASVSLEVYPGATELPTQMHGSIAFCGTKMTTVAYRVNGASAETVAAWYGSHIPGGIRITLPVENGDTVMEVFEPGGQAAAAISQIHFDPRLAAAAKSLGADRTTLGLVAFDPPLSTDSIGLIRSAAGGDASARARIKAECASGGTTQ
jgi:hypothetical protein